MENQNGQQWAAVFVSKEAIARAFTSEKTGKDMTEIVLPEALPAGAPAVSKWRFYMPSTCVKEAKTGSFRVSFPPSWKSIRFYSPYVKGKRSEMMDFPIDDAIALLQDSFATKKK